MQETKNETERMFLALGPGHQSHQRALGNAKWKLPDGNQLDPAAGAEYLGIPNVCRVVMCGSPQPPFDDESRKLAAMHKVVWSAIGDSGSTRNDKETDLEEVLRQAKLFPNVKGAVFDDFFGHFLQPEEHWARYSVGDVLKIREKLTMRRTVRWTCGSSGINGGWNIRSTII